ncbi:unnamed protein product [Urochloa humidicola]
MMQIHKHLQWFQALGKKFNRARRFSHSTDVFCAGIVDKLQERKRVTAFSSVILTRPSWFPRTMHSIIGPAIIGKDPTEQVEIDNFMVQQLDGTSNDWAGVNKSLEQMLFLPCHLLCAKLEPW